MAQSAASTAPPGREIATLAGGCFWCLEAVFDELKGVESVESGYMGGRTGNPTYHQVCEGNTGHAEVVRITFDPAVVSFDELLEVFFVTHDPTTLNCQGNDVGTQYRSAVFYHTPGQKAAAETVIARLERGAAVGRSHRDRGRPGGGVLRRGGLPPGVLRAQSVPAVLPGDRGAESAEVSQALPREAEAHRLRVFASSGAAHGQT